MSLTKLFDFFRGNPSVDKQLKKLLKQIDNATDELKIKTAESFATLAGLEQTLSQTGEVLSDSDEARISAIKSAIAAEKLISEGLKQVFADLKSRRADIELAIEQNLTRQRKAEANELLTFVYKNFGSELTLNKYLEKLSSESLKLELTSESNLKIELLRKDDSRL